MNSDNQKNLLEIMEKLNKTDHKHKSFNR